MKSVNQIIALLAIWCIALSCHADGEREQMIAYLQQAQPTVKWDANSGVIANFDGGRNAGGAALGYAANKVYLAIQTSQVGKSRSIQYFEFSVGPGAQAGICSAPAKLEVYPLECTTEDGALPGCKAAKGMSGLSVVDGECDFIHLYWNQSLHKIQWWRR